MKEKFNRFVSWWALRVPGWLIYLALFVLASKAYVQLESGGNFSEVLTPYLTTIGLTIALASVIFSDARLKFKDEQEYLVSAGELLLNAAVNLILSLLVFWLASGGCSEDSSLREVLAASMVYINHVFLRTGISNKGCTQSSSRTHTSRTVPERQIFAERTLEVASPLTRSPRRPFRSAFATASLNSPARNI